MSVPTLVLLVCLLSVSAPANASFIDDFIQQIREFFDFCESFIMGNGDENDNNGDDTIDDGTNGDGSNGDGSNGDGSNGDGSNGDSENQDPETRSKLHKFKNHAHMKSKNTHSNMKIKGHNKHKSSHKSKGSN